MRAVAQRVTSARVCVADEVAFEMGSGLLALVAVGRGDTADVAQAMARRLVQLRIFEDAEERLNRSLLDSGGTLGLVSQFTLYGDARRGRRPSFVDACPAEQAAPLIEAVAEQARALGAPVVTGRFQTRMEVSLVNSGPVTILLDSDKQF